MLQTFQQTKQRQQIMDWALGLAGVPAKDQRVQVKMPAAVVKEIDRLFPEIDRSELLTQLAIQAIYQQLRFADRPELAELANAEQSLMDEQWDYLEKRDAGL